MTLTEGDLQIIFNNPLNARKFDDPHVHGLSHCMKAVDFICRDAWPLSVYRTQGSQKSSSFERQFAALYR